jgi:hypothetical protein
MQRPTGQRADETTPEAMPPEAASIPSEGESTQGRRETAIERLDRNLEELLAGIRVALPGVQVLFAFLLVLPFQQQFDDVTSFQEKVYFGTLLCTAVASILLIAPSARHRVQFRRGDKAYIVFTANRLALSGLGFLGLAMTGAILLISDFLFGAAVAVCSTAAVGVGLAWVWFASPLMRRLRHR